MMVDPIEVEEEQSVEAVPEVAPDASTAPAEETPKE